jgi:glycolate oxidase iron-sulfur subunit
MAAMAETPDLLDHTPSESLDNCLSCRRCEAVCPANVSYERLLLASRAELAPKSSMRTRAMLWLMSHKPWLNALLSLYQFCYEILPKPWRFITKPPKKQTLGSGTSKNAIFTGCIADIYEQPTRAALMQLLQATGESADISTQQVCCGQAARHAGDTKTAEQLAKQNNLAFQHYERILVLASGCNSALQDTLNIPVIDACTYINQLAEKLNFKSAKGLTIALHTPCSASFDKSHLAVIALLKRIPDLQIIALPDTGCCGAAGLHQFNQPNRAAQMRDPILEAINASIAELILSQNIGCRLHIAKAASIPVMHPIEFMAQFLNDI